MNMSTNPNACTIVRLPRTEAVMAAAVLVAAADAVDELLDSRLEPSTPLSRRLARIRTLAAA